MLCPACHADLPGFARECAACGRQVVFADGIPGIEADPFWGRAAVPRMPRWPGRRFFLHGAPPRRTPFLARSARDPLVLAATLCGIGFFSVFVNQANNTSLFDPIWGFLFQLAVGAPVFEEFFKFGLALLIVAPLARRRATSVMARVLLSFLAIPLGGVLAWEAARAGLLPGPVSTTVIVAAVAAWLIASLQLAGGASLRVLIAWLVGAGFGVLEHYVTYVEEPAWSYLGRVLFHGGATALSMVAYSILHGAADVRVRWFATVPAILFHWGVNAFAIPMAIIEGLGVPGIGTFWAGTMTLATYLAMAALAIIPAGFREYVRIQVQARLPAWRPPAAATPAGRNLPTPR